MLGTSFIILAYEGISSYLHNKRQKALQKAFMAMENKVNLQCNNIFHLDDSMEMYSIYNSDTLKNLVNTVHNMHNRTTWNKKLFTGKVNHWYLSRDQIDHYAINSLLSLTTTGEKYVKMYKRFISHLQVYVKAIRILLKVYLPISLFPPSKLQEILGKVKKAIQTTNPDYNIVIKRLHL